MEKEVTTTMVREFISTVFVVDKGKVLMTWNLKVNNWVPIGGHIDSNQLPCESVIREAKEESNLDIEIHSNPNITKSIVNLPQPFNVHLDHVKEDHKHINLTYFATIKKGSGECFEIDDEGKPLKWFSREDLNQDDSLIPAIKEWALEALDELE
jgi:8-oxo-dGTP pyrophosphatase MutT (NUDIX family)